MIIVFYSNDKYEYMAESLIKSILINDKYDCQMVYYTVDFDSQLDYKNLTKIRYNIIEKLPSFCYYKPLILLEVLNDFKDNEQFLFLDVDLIVGKRFDINRLFNNYDFPLFTIGTWDYPFCCSFDLNDNVIQNTIVDERNLMGYFGITHREQYLYTGMFSFNLNCRDFIEEWASICVNKYLLKYEKKYFPFPDETAANIVLRRRENNKNLGIIFVNTGDFSMVKFLEENDNYVGIPENNYGVFGDIYSRCQNSSDIMFYHGIKDQNILSECIDYFQNKSM